MKPNPEQRALIESSSVVTIGIAGPGSGKTGTLIERIKSKPADCRMVVLVFTNTAANEIRKRLTAQKWDVKRLQYLGTRHGYCFRLIQTYGEVLGYQAGGVTILPESEVEARLLTVRDRLSIKLSGRKLLDKDGETKLTLIEKQQRGLIWREYDFELRRSNMVDYDGILREAERLLKSSVVLRSLSFHELLVDEKQDDSEIDWRIDSALPCDTRFYIGDPDQSIYAFRDANPTLLIQETTCKGRTTLYLEGNYRSDMAICEAASQLIRHNTGRLDKDLRPYSTELGELTLTIFPDGWAEVDWLASRCRDLQHTHSIAVLLRLNAEAGIYRRALISQGVKVATSARHWGDMPRAILLLSILLAPGNAILVERFLKLDNPATTVDRWKLNAVLGGKEIANRLSGILEKFLDGKLPGYLLGNGVSEETERAIRARSDALGLDDSTLADLIHDLNSRDESSASDGVFVGTIHGAKGREWDTVFMPAFEEGLLPFTKNDIEEERRLAFVGMTRARHGLHLSLVEQRQRQWGPVTPAAPSRFIKEMGL